ncbi:SRPBCC family protein [Pinirhizobacter soli]|uniref:SRPBCC family protein n=1 Tax=Pinirhizobacter soli TaxID=2786953 RepID=UPI00202A8C30|nr:SRPBCC family protein [Pinirhizobacter soli]
MPSYQTSITIDASPESIWQILTTVVAWPRWLPTVNSIEPLDGDTLAIGHRFRIRQPKLQPATWVVSKVEPNRRFEWRASSPGVLMVADHVIESLAPGKTSALLRFEFRGVVGSLLGLLFSSTTQRYIQQEAASLKAAAER